MLIFGDSFTFRSADNFNNQYYTAGIANASPNGRGGENSANGVAEIKLPARVQQCDHRSWLDCCLLVNRLSRFQTALRLSVAA